jgi:hypothetical protein
VGNESLQVIALRSTPERYSFARRSSTGADGGHQCHAVSLDQP